MIRYAAFPRAVDVGRGREVATTRKLATMAAMLGMMEAI
jgi:uncharacterized protein (DUF1697 family)